MERRAITISGTVQGVGFRPFVFGLANELQLRGFVRNVAGSVAIEAEGSAESLDRLLVLVKSRPPVLSRIDAVSWTRIPLLGGESFRIESSIAGDQPVVISPDVATCDDCLAELFDPADRRYRYPFLNCTNCGPRLTIILGSPYDRARTTMAAFDMCAACRAEYEAPTNRRFHAQPTACAVCGPGLRAFDSRGQPVETDQPLACFAGAIQRGQIGAMKGLGGYHLVCDAGNEAAVGELRRRKHRDEKPFAVMVRDVAAAERLCAIIGAERELLCSSQRPIVLMRKRDGIASIAAAVAPGNAFLGVMLPYTPLHHLLLHDLPGMALVMTSGNRSDEPIAIGEPDVFEKLAGIADMYLTHDRPIQVRCDDSVSRVIGGHESPIRRSRGYAPRPMQLPVSCAQPILATGGQMKATFALGQDRRAIVSHHLGDLDHFEAYRAFEQDVGLYEKLFGITPLVIAHDLHPDYATTRYAARRAEAGKLRLTPIQHHHAHMASCMAEHGLNQPVIGVSFDGTGFGTDGAVWGGEFLFGDFYGFRRWAHLRYAGLPGGERTIREPWRMAVSHLLDADCDCAAMKRRLSSVAVKTVQQMIERQFNTPLTSSAGRLFDAVAALIGVRDTVSYEGQAAIQLEWLAASVPPAGTYPFELIEQPGEQSGQPIIIDTRPLIRAVAAEVDCGIAPAVIARRFHSCLVEIISAICGKIRNSTGVHTVVCSGGVFMNELLSIESRRRLSEDGFEVYQHRLVPPNDGGLSLGQLAIAGCQLMGSASTVF